MGHAQLPTTPSPQVASARFERRKARNDKTDAARTLLAFSEMDTEVTDPEPTTVPATETQTDITGVAFDAMTNELAHLQKKSDSMSLLVNTQIPYSQEFFIGNDDKVKYFTGLGTPYQLNFWTQEVMEIFH
ncbi:uncharacterized protein LOC127849802 [Dreissena polymorpha]|uniref:uncharacterized protein LOC127849802 n=1 Tax=Dreissena polymorpha TaxID=45954 RepID=UPI0022641847|nr:uncharacterized protein LOC127849802 [Dreissena polymorpha]